MRATKAKSPADKKIYSINAFHLAGGADRASVTKWSKRADFPDLKKGVDVQTVKEYTRVRLDDAKKHMTGKDADLKKVKLQKQIEILDFEIKQAARDDAISKIEYEAKRGLWFSVDQVKAMAVQVASAFDEAVNAVELTTRNAKAVAQVRDSFDRIRENLAKEIGGK